MTMRKLFFCFSLLVCTFNANSAYTSITNLRQDLINYERIAVHGDRLPSEDKFKALVASGYVYGTFELAVEMGMSCSPNGLVSGQLISSTVNYLTDHPEKWHESTALVVLKGFTERFPCDN